MHNTVGIETKVFNFFTAAQKNSNWCWAASIQMVLNYYGINITQEQIVLRTYGRDRLGRIPDLPCTIETIHRNLNNWNIDNSGKSYSVSAYFGQGAPNAVQLVNQLALFKPIIIAYRYYDVSHIMVITAVEYVKLLPDIIRIEKVIVRDPWPDQRNLMTLGRNEFNGTTIKSKILGYWFINVLSIN